MSRWYDPAIGRFTQPDTIIPGASDPQAWDRYAYTGNNPLRYTDPSGHKACDSFNDNGECIVDKDWESNKSGFSSRWTQDPGYDSESKSIPTWGSDQSDPWRVERSARVWNWICTSGGWWGDGCPSGKDLAAWLLWQEGGLLYNRMIYEDTRNSATAFEGRRAIVGLASLLFSDGDISSTDLSKFTAFFNPNSGGAFDASDWEELMSSPAPPIDYFYEVDLYWNKPYMDNGNVVDRWWMENEEYPCNTCKVAFSVVIPPGPGNDSKEDVLFKFGYVP